jgi:hypothetical protein
MAWWLDDPSATPSRLASGIVTLSHSHGGRLARVAQQLHQVLSPKNARHESGSECSTATSVEGSKSVLANSRGVDARHDAGGIPTEAAQLLGGQDVDDE